MKKEDFNELVASIKEVIAIKRGEKQPAEVLEFPEPKNIRKKLNLSQVEFAEFLGVKIGTLRNWEQGRRSVPTTAKRLLKIADKYPDVFLASI